LCVTETVDGPCDCWRRAPSRTRFVNVSVSSWCHALIFLWSGTTLPPIRDKFDEPILSPPARIVRRQEPIIRSRACRDSDTDRAEPLSVSGAGNRCVGSGRWRDRSQHPYQPTLDDPSGDRDHRDAFQYFCAACPRASSFSRASRTIWGLNRKSLGGLPAFVF